jgi:hypothetical protein
MTTKQAHDEQTTVSTGSMTEQIATALKEIKFGSLEIIIHDGKIVQIEKKEKIRFNLERQSR